MMIAKCSDMPRFWAVKEGDRWLIFDRDHADKYVASMSMSVYSGTIHCNWHLAGYWNIPISEWREAIARI